MALSSSTLATELETMTPTSSASTAADRLAKAYGKYMGAATSNGVPIVYDAVKATAVPAMAAALAFVVPSTPAQGAAVVVAGVAAFWAAMVATPAAFFAGASAVTQPTFATLAASLAAAFGGNVSEGRALDEAVAAIADELHAATAGHGTATFPGPVTSPIL